MSEEPVDLARYSLLSHHQGARIRRHDICVSLASILDGQSGYDARLLGKRAFASRAGTELTVFRLSDNVRANRLALGSGRHQAMERGFAQQGSGDASHQPLAQATVAVGSGNDQICTKLLGNIDEDLAI